MSEPRRASILIRCDGGTRLGFGHVVRCLAVSSVLRERYDAQVSFAMAGDARGEKRVREAGFSVVSLRTDHEEVDLEEAFELLRPVALLCDVRSDLAREALERWRSRGCRIGVLDDASSRRLAADLVFYPPVPQVEALDWRGCRGERCVGWEWIVLRPEFTREWPSSASGIPRVLVSLGGSDPEGLSVRVIEALEGLETELRGIVLVGPGFKDPAALEARLDAGPVDFESHRDPESPATLMARSDLAVVAFGMTAYELAALGVPALYLCGSEDHARSASALVAIGAGRSLGVARSLDDAMLRDAIREALATLPALRENARRAKQRIDGRGAERIAERLIRAGVSHV